MRHLRKELKALLTILTVIYLFIGLGLAEGTKVFTFKIILIECLLIGLSFANIYVLDVYR